MGTIIVKDRQTLLDVALETSGSVESVMELAILNGRSLTSELTDGEELISVGETESKVVERYRAEGVSPATEATVEDRMSMPYAGIGLMAVGIDFEVG